MTHSGQDGPDPIRVSLAQRFPEGSLVSVGAGHISVVMANEKQSAARIVLKPIDRAYQRIEAT
jgi:hypothetical protein